MLIDWIRIKNRKRLERRNARRHRKKTSLCAGIKFNEQVDPKTLNIHASDHPEVSIIIPGYGKADYTLRCLKSLTTSGIGCRYEVIVVEDASGDPSAELLRQVTGIRLIWNPQNLGFLRSCNKAAEQARGEFIYLLNNDTILLKGALNALVETARARPDAGIVGSKLIYPNGTLQEAGGVVWANGDAANYGRNQDPHEPRYNYMREADYISGASILLRRALWKLVGGFDDRFAPAYYEDTDLSIRLQKMGRPTLYVPHSVVVHCEGVSNGTSTDHGVKAYQVVNREKFIAAHEEYLRRTRGHSGDLSCRSIDALRRRAGLVLIIDHYLPEPDMDAGSRNMMEFIHTLLSLNYAVKFWPQNMTGIPKYLATLEAMGVEALRGPYQRSFDEWIASVGKDVTHVLLSRPTVAPFYMDAVRRHSNAQVMYYGHDLHYARMRMEAEIKRDPSIAAEADKMQQTEMKIWAESDLVLYPSQEEVDTVLALSPKLRAAFVPPFKFDHFTVADRPHAGHKVLFVAGFKHSPNVDAAIWLSKEIMPKVWQECPQAELYLVGSSPTSKVLALAEPGRVFVTGTVSEDELAHHYASARVSVVPLRFGAGVKLKVLETMQFGVPLVTTKVGLQGLPGANNTIQPKDTPEEIAAELLQLLHSEELWMTRSQAQTEYVRSQFSTQRMRETFAERLRAQAAFKQPVELLDTVSDTTENQAIRIIDGFTFYNEVDMLDVRLRYLAPYVDEFLIVEADHKFSGEAKPLLLKELMQSDRFAWIANKVRIRSVHIDTRKMELGKRPEQFDPTSDFWKIESTQRNAIRPSELPSHDFLLMGDLDEIPNPQVLERLRNDRQFRAKVRLEPHICSQSFFYYGPHCLKKDPWAGTAVIGSAVAGQLSNQEIREQRYTWHSLANGGWHFSYFMPPEQIADKIGAFSHQEYNNDFMRDTARIREMIAQRKDLFNRGEAFIPFDQQSLPMELRTLLSSHFSYPGLI